MKEKTTVAQIVSYLAIAKLYCGIVGEWVQSEGVAPEGIEDFACMQVALEIAEKIDVPSGIENPVDQIRYIIGRAKEIRL